MTGFLVVAAGGALGAVGRYVVIARIGAWLGTAVPYGTLVVNVAGSLLLGVAVAMATELKMSENGLLFFGVGVLGGFTTFSTFALDVAYLTGRRATRTAIAYVVASVALSIVAFAAGLAVAQALA